HVVHVSTYLFIVSSSNRCSGAVERRQPGSSARPADGSQRLGAGTTSPPGARFPPSPTGARSSAKREADEAVERRGDRAGHGGEEVGGQDQEAEQQEDPVLAEEADEGLA